MMLFKLSLKNIRKSISDYSVYFLTLVLGVAIFYMFNSLGSQEAMLEVSSSKREILKLLTSMVGMVSVLVSIVLGFLIVYANNFLIKRRKKEFGIYMMLGMGKGKVSRILFYETFFVGVLSLVIGLFAGVFGSQLMSAIVARLFEADMSSYRFVFSEDAASKSCLYFGVMYLAVMVLNVFTVSKYKLIDLLTAIRKNEKVKMKSPLLCVPVFLASVAVLCRAYYMVTNKNYAIRSLSQLEPPILMGVIATFLIFWSLSGFILRLVQTRKKIYLRGTNLFVLRQLHNRINTTVVSMTIICLLLFMTVSVLSTALALNHELSGDLEEMTPVDINLYKSANLPDNGEYSKKAVEDSRLPVSDTLKRYGIDDKLKNVIEIPLYATNELTLIDTFGELADEVKAQLPMLAFDNPETILHLSDYNRIAKAYGQPRYELNENEYLILCEFDNMTEIRNKALERGISLTIAGKDYVPRYKECRKGFIEISNSHTNTGLILVPDSCPLTEDMKKEYFLAADYNAENEKEAEEIEKIFVDNNSVLIQGMEKDGIKALAGMSKRVLYESAKGVSVIITFIALYLGIIFLITSSAILALKELSENADNRQRYTVLRKIGVDEEMINKSLFRQIAIFFFAPLVLAVIHSVFGIRFALNMVSVSIKPSELLPSVIGTAIFLVVVYGGYFLATYKGSQHIIREE